MPSPPLFFDTHVHLDALPLGWDPAEKIREARHAGVGEFLIPGVHRHGWPDLMRLSREIPFVWEAPGLHPQAAGEWGEEARTELAGILADSRAVAIGEIGLDALIDFVPAELQEGAFRGQLRLAVEAGVPVLIHCRQATERLLRILREEGARKVGGIFHAFSGSPETARQAVALGFAIAFGGSLTYPQARRAPEVLKNVPSEWIVLETDAPDIPPHPHRGEDNLPAWLELVAREVAGIRGWTLEETARITTENARRVLKIG